MPLRDVPTHRPIANKEYARDRVDGNGRSPGVRVRTLCGPLRREATIPFRQHCVTAPA